MVPLRIGDLIRSSARCPRTMTVAPSDVQARCIGIQMFSLQQSNGACTGGSGLSARI
jgi:hypothetical protein